MWAVSEHDLTLLALLGVRFGLTEVPRICLFRPFLSHLDCVKSHQQYLVELRIGCLSDGPPAEMRQCDSLKQFKLHLKTHFFRYETTVS